MSTQVTHVVAKFLFPIESSTSEGSIYSIHHTQGNSQGIVFQDDYPEPGRNSNQWAYLGKYQLDNQSYVKLSQQTQDVESKFVGADAVMFVPALDTQPTPTPGPTLTPAPLPEPETVIYLPMDENIAGGYVTLRDQVKPAQDGEAWNTTSVVHEGYGYARHLPQENNLYSSIRFDQDDSLYLANAHNHSLTIDLWLRYAGGSGETQTLANLAGRNSSGIHSGWVLQYDPNISQFKFTVYSGSASGTTRKNVKLQTSFASSDWVRVRAIKDGTANKLILCVSVNDGGTLYAEIDHYQQGIY